LPILRISKERSRLSDIFLQLIREGREGSGWIKYSFALVWETQNSQEAIEVMQKGLDDFEAGRFRSFYDFAAE
jgi:hypothetical protein